ncbi:MAG TPA: hypothetical protein VKS81_08230 [Bacteroidota bacterium]|nr:hypothetical protein [Bacteroidota bacterium]
MLTVLKYAVVFVLAVSFMGSYLDIARLTSHEGKAFACACCSDGASSSCPMCKELQRSAATCGCAVSQSPCGSQRHAEAVTFQQLISNCVSSPVIESPMTVDAYAQTAVINVESRYCSSLFHPPQA